MLYTPESNCCYLSLIEEKQEVTAIQDTADETSVNAAAVAVHQKWSFRIKQSLFVDNMFSPYSNRALA